MTPSTKEILEINLPLLPKSSNDVADKLRKGRK